MKWFLIYQIYNYCIDSMVESIKEKFNHQQISYLEGLSIFLRSIKSVPNTRKLKSLFTLEFAPDLIQSSSKSNTYITKLLSGEMEKEMDKRALGIRDSEVSYDPIKQKNHRYT